MPKPIHPRFLLLVVAATAAVCIGPASLAQTNSEGAFKRVEVHVERNHWLNALRELRDLKQSEEAKIKWLEGKAEEGSVPAQFELSAMLHQRDFERSLEWYARAVLGRALDAASCSEPRGGHTLLDRVEPVRSDGI